MQYFAAETVPVSYTPSNRTPGEDEERKRKKMTYPFSET